MMRATPVGYYFLSFRFVLRARCCSRGVERWSLLLAA